MPENSTVLNRLGHVLHWMSVGLAAIILISSCIRTFSSPLDEITNHWGDYLISPILALIIYTFGLMMRYIFVGELKFHMPEKDSLRYLLKCLFFFMYATIAIVFWGSILGFGVPYVWHKIEHHIKPGGIDIIIFSIIILIISPLIQKWWEILQEWWDTPSKKKFQKK